ncbi:MAG: hypothetical protein F4W90_02885 [Gammaproteobacteria bacterium]|nr:hypothetical protein [Gammaproteobacteria bacterium]
MTNEQKLASAADQLRSDGYTVVEDLISGERLERARRDAEALMERTPIQMPGVSGPVHGRMCKELFSKSRAFDDLYCNELVLGIVNEILGESTSNANMWGGLSQLSGTMLKDVVPAESARGFHRDDVLYPIPRPHPPLVINTLLALDPFTKDTGATWVVPKSHTWDCPIDQETSYEVMEMNPGSMLLIDGGLWHTNGVNTTTTQHRKALNMYYSCRWLKPIAGFNLGLPDHAVSELDAPLRAIL